MPKLLIPKEYRAGLSQVKNLTPELISEIRSTLDQATLSSAPERAAAQALTSVNSLKPEQLKQIGTALGSLYGVRARNEGISLGDFVNDVSEAMENLSEEDGKLLPSERDTFCKNLSRLLESETFALNSKAYDLATDDERTFCSTRILTDLRPVFAPKVEDNPKGMVIVHLLKISFHQGHERHKEFYVSLDGDDLKEMKLAIERAERKSASLQNLVKDVRIFGLAKE
jgi:hypothetical protein